MKVSVIIPAFNEEDCIGRCLTGVLNQTVPADEIIVVDNNCTDKTAAIAGKFGVKIISEKIQGMTPARNRGFNSSKYDIVARIDADVVVPSDWISRIKKNFVKKGVDALTGPVILSDSRSKLIAKSPLPAHIYIESLKFLSNGKIYLMGPNMSLTRDIWLKVKNKVNLDDKKVHEDLDLSLKIIKIGGKIKYDKKLIVYGSVRRMEKHPESFFIEYPIRMIKTFRANKK